MCRTSSPPRRDLYELANELAANEGGFFVPKSERKRIGTDNESRRIEIYNANYGASGVRLGDYERPWSVLTPWDGRMFTTYTEALEWALKEAAK